MKKTGALLLALLLLLTQLFAAAAEDVKETEAIVYDHLTVGNPTRMKGDFFTGLWGNATSDLDVRDLLHGYNLVMWNGEQGMFAFNPTVVSDVIVMDNETGDRSYALTLFDDLYYSDGTKITARDYAFSILLQISPEIAALGGVPVRMDYLMGYEAYAQGTAAALAGVRVMGDDALLFTVRHEYLPFFYELGLLMCNPYPIHVIAPGVAVMDDGDGVYLANRDQRVQAPIFTAELLRETVLNDQTGYRSHPSVVSGPYTLTAFDGTTAEFAMNPYYKGNAAGVKPTIPNLTYTLADNETMVEKLQNGEFGLLNKVMKVDSIQQGMALVQEEPILMSNYPRVGLSYISFACERPTVAGEAVRQAIAWCMDREQVMQEYTGNFGLRVDGYFGIGQWMYGLAMGTTEPPIDPPEDENDREALTAYEEALAAYQALSLENLTAYTADIERAIRLLEEDGWKLNEQGIREKEIDGQAVTLDLKMIYPAGNAIKDAFEAHFIPNLEAAGIRLTMEPVEMTELLGRYYKQGETRDMDMIYLASNFELVFDPAVQFIVDESGAPNWSYTNHQDEELYRLALSMRETEPGDVLTYMQKWIAFQERFNQSLPMLPIYSNIYFDFYTNTLHDYAISANATWGEAIVPSYLAEYVEGAPEGEEGLESDDGLMSFDD